MLRRRRQARADGSGCAPLGWCRLAGGHPDRPRKLTGRGPAGGSRQKLCSRVAVQTFPTAVFRGCAGLPSWPSGHRDQPSQPGLQARLTWLAESKAARTLMRRPGRKGPAKPRKPHLDPAGQNYFRILGVTRRRQPPGPRQRPSHLRGGLAKREAPDAKRRHRYPHILRSRSS